MANDKILLIGACGQIGAELTLELRNMYGAANVIAADIKDPAPEIKEGGPFVHLNVLVYHYTQIISVNYINRIFALHQQFSIVE